MNRLRQPQAEAMREAYARIPSRLHDGLGCDLFCADPIFAGIFVPPWDNESMADGRSYRRVAHVGWPYHTRDKRTTIVWPQPYEASEAVQVAVHELGHVLHAHLAERVGWLKMPWLRNVSQYATTNYSECFAEAFTAWAIYTPRMMDEHSYWFGYRRENAEFFDRLLAE